MGSVTMKHKIFCQHENNTLSQCQISAGGKLSAGPRALQISHNPMTSSLPLLSLHYSPKTSAHLSVMTGALPMPCPDPRPLVHGPTCYPGAYFGGHQDACTRLSSQRPPPAHSPYCFKLIATRCHSSVTPPSLPGHTQLSS